MDITLILIFLKGYVKGIPIFQQCEDTTKEVM